MWDGVIEMKKNASAHTPAPTPSDITADVAQEENRGDEDGQIGIKPVISIQGRQLLDITNEVLDALVAANNPPRLFKRGGELVRVAQDEQDETYRLKRVTENMLVGEMTRSADFTRQKNKGTEQGVSPPRDVAKNIPTQATLQFPTIVGLVETPVVRPDGSVFDEVGYDTVTNLYLTQKFDLAIPENPTQNDAKIAVRYVIDEVLHDFMFVDDASIANTLGTMLTILMRPAIDGYAPLVLFDKPQPGTGASLLVDLIAMISTGKSAGVATAPKTEDEMRKRITSLLMDGYAVALIDNVSDTLRSASLSAVLTAKEWTDRILGRSEMITVPNNATWMVTGNNLALSDELTRRSYLIRQDVGAARPWLRKQRGEWKHDNIDKWVADHRTEILSALLTMVRAWFVAGCLTSNTRSIGSFEEWCEKIGGVLTYAGIDDFLGNMDDMYERMDEDAADWNGFLLYLQGSFPKGFSTKHLVDDIEAGGKVVDIAPTQIVEVIAKRSAVTRRVGKILKKQVDVRYPNGLVLTAEKDSHAHVMVWLVEGETKEAGDSNEED